jgi:hypothetical protein
MSLLAVMACWTYSWNSLVDHQLMMAVAAMAMQTRKLLDTHTTLGPSRLHIGSIRNELNPRMICRLSVRKLQVQERSWFDTRRCELNLTELSSSPNAPALTPSWNADI